MEKTVCFTSNPHGLVPQVGPFIRHLPDENSAPAECSSSWSAWRELFPSSALLPEKPSPDLLSQLPLSRRSWAVNKTFLSPAQGAKAEEALPEPCSPPNGWQSLYPLIFTQHLAPPGALDSCSGKKGFFLRCLFLDFIKPTSDLSTKPVV